MEGMRKQTADQNKTWIPRGCPGSMQPFGPTPVSYLTLSDISLAPESIVWVGDDAMAKEAAQAICNGDETCIGFDSEWHPLHQDEISLVQIATTTQCFLFDACALSSPATWAGILATFSAGGEGKQRREVGLERLVQEKA